ncbi:hypothetical protein [Rhizobium sophoriradicis]|uniref:Uncharacterized protein n=1 Tax=Rhizobium sophoriradicis TaxID=1535245 RepID=A0A2A5KV97_9HYPH|nr:hypothetical protein [Rhizobium sophoriradicis]PCK80989.1 hypothetical protein CPT34_11155 [Rhizobium sophoriradicis]
MATKYQPLYKWRGTKIDESNQPTDLDWLGYDGQIIIGRIRMESGGQKNGQWQWSGLGPRVRQRLAPQQGFEAEPREAIRKVEEYYHRLMRLNGMRGSKDGR